MAAVTTSDISGEQTTWGDDTVSNGPVPWEEVYDEYTFPGRPDKYSIAETVVGLITTSGISLVGLTGNIMVILVVIRVNTMHTPTNCYLVALAFADLLFVFFGCIPGVSEYIFRTVDQIWFGRFLCGPMIFAQYLGVNASSLCITAFSVERYVAICHPIKSHIICTTSRARKISLGIWFFSVSYCFAWIFLAEQYIVTYHPVVDVAPDTPGALWHPTDANRSVAVVNDTMTVKMCLPSLPRDKYRTIYMIDLILFYAIPLLLTAVLYGRIIVVLMRSQLPSHRGNHSNLENGQSSQQRQVNRSKFQVSRSR